MPKPVSCGITRCVSSRLRRARPAAREACGALIPLVAIDPTCVLHTLDQLLKERAAQRVTLDIERITSYALQLDTASAKRLGWVLEQLGFESPPLAALPIKGYRKLDPSGPNSGPHTGSWMCRG